MVIFSQSILAFSQLRQLAPGCSPLFVHVSQVVAQTRLTGL